MEDVAKHNAQDKLLGANFKSDERVEAKRIARDQLEKENREREERERREV